MKLAIAALAALAFAAPAHAQIDEVRGGIAAHDLRWIGTLDKKEPSVALQGEVIFEEPEFLKWALSPHPYVAGTLNLADETSYGGAGLMWRTGIGERFYGDFSFGLVVHDGALTVKYEPVSYLASAGLTPQDITPESSTAVIQALFEEFLFRDANTIEYGSRVLFREQLTLGYRINDDWAAEAFFEHISNGYLLSDRANDGSDAGGFRVARRF